MTFLTDYWWLILVLLVGMIFSAVRELRHIDHTQYLNRPKNKTPTDTKTSLDDKVP